MEQNYANHRRWVPMYHFVSSLLTLAVLIGSIVNLFKSMGGSGLYSASLIAAMAFNFAIIFFYSRTFALKAQDRAIRAEENLRHFIMTGQPLNGKLNIRQIIGLRFAADDEYVELEKRAVAENMKEEDIKKAIKHWRADTYRA